MSTYLTVKEAAIFARRHPETIREALRSEELHGFQRTFGGSWIIDESCVTAWMHTWECEHQKNEFAA